MTQNGKIQVLVRITSDYSWASYPIITLLPLTETQSRILLAALPACLDILNSKYIGKEYIYYTIYPKLFDNKSEVTK